MLLVFLSGELSPNNKSSIPDKIIKIDPNGTVVVPEGSVAVEFKCLVEGNPTENVTWETGIENDRN